MKRIYELEEALIDTFRDEVIGKGEKWFWVQGFVEKVLRESINESQTSPFSISGSYSYAKKSYNGFTVKAKGTSTKLLAIEMDIERDNDYYPIDIKGVKVESLTNMINSYQEFIDYSNDRITRLEKSYDKKAAKFYDMLNEKGVDAKFFFELQQEFNGLSATVRSKIYADSKK